MDLMVLYEFSAFDLLEIDKEIEIKGEIQNKKIDNKDLHIKDTLFFNLKISRKGSKFLIEGNIDTAIILPCDRCLTNYEMQVNSDFNFLFLYGKEQSEYIEGHILNIKDLILSEIFINIPFKKLCSATCKGLCPVCGEDLNIKACNCIITEKSNPFSELKRLLIN